MHHGSMRPSPRRATASLPIRRLPRRAAAGACATPVRGRPTGAGPPSDRRRADGHHDRIGPYHRDQRGLRGAERTLQLVTGGGPYPCRALRQHRHPARTSASACCARSNRSPVRVRPLAARRSSSSERPAERRNARAAEQRAGGAYPTRSSGARGVGQPERGDDEAITARPGADRALSAQDILFHERLIAEHSRATPRSTTAEVAVLGALPYPPDLDVTPFMVYLVTGGFQFAYS